MKKYAVEMVRDANMKYYYIQNLDTMEIELLPTKFLTHKTRANESPNTICRMARAICYYMNYCYSRQMDLTDVYQLDYEAQFRHFTDFLQWMKAGNHTENLKQPPKNGTCNTYLKNVFRFFSFLEMAEEQFGSLQVLSYGTISMPNSVGVKRKLRFRAFAGYLKEEEREVRAAEKNEIVTILEACTNCRDQLLILMHRNWVSESENCWELIIRKTLTTKTIWSASAFGMTMKMMPGQSMPKNEKAESVMTLTTS